MTRVTPVYSPPGSNLIPMLGLDVNNMVVTNDNKIFALTIVTLPLMEAQCKFKFGPESVTSQPLLNKISTFFSKIWISRLQPVPYLHCSEGFATVLSSFLEFLSICLHLIFEISNALLPHLIFSTFEILNTQLPPPSPPTVWRRLRCKTRLRRKFVPDRRGESRWTPPLAWLRYPSRSS